MHTDRVWCANVGGAIQIFIRTETEQNAEKSRVIPNQIRHKFDHISGRSENLYHLLRFSAAHVYEHYLQIDILVLEEREDLDV